MDGGGAMTEQPPGSVQGGFVPKPGYYGDAEQREAEMRAELDDIYPTLDDDDGEDTDCSHCGGEGLCWDGSDPLGDCPDESHACHACGGSGRGKDQVIW